MTDKNANVNVRESYYVDCVTMSTIFMTINWLRMDFPTVSGGWWLFLVINLNLV